MVPEDFKQCLEPIVCCCVKHPEVEGMELVDDGRYVTSPEWVGSSILFWGKKRSKFPYQCFVGPDWPVVMLTYFLMIAAHVVVFAVIYKPLGWLPVLIGSITGFFLLWSFTATIATDPGIIYKPMPEPAGAAGAETGPTGSTGASGSGTITSTALNTALLGSAAAANNNSKSKDKNSGGSDIEEGAPNRGTRERGGSGSGVSLLPTNNIGGFQEVQSGITPAHLAAAMASGKSTTVAPPPTTATGGASASASNSGDVGNPGAVNPPAYHGVPSTVECGQCNLQRPYSARHCYYCNVCIDELDHHCPWCGKCIGENNMTAFRFFVSLVNFQCYYLIGCFLYMVLYPSL